MKIYFSPTFIQEPINCSTYQEERREYLLFENSNTYVFGSLSEKKSQDNPESSPPKIPPKDNSENPPPEPNPTKSESQKEEPETLKVVLIVSGIMVGLIFFSFIITTNKKIKIRSPVKLIYNKK